MNNLIEFIENYWVANELGNKNPNQVMQGLSPEFASNIFIGYNELGNRCLFLQTENLSLPSVQHEKTNISLIVSKPNKLVYIELNDLYFGEIFNDLIVSIVNKIKNIPEESNLVTFVALYKKWNELFKSNIEKGNLSENELLGLIGELSFLEERVNNSLDAFEVNAALEAWSGPDGKANDFIFPGISYEIKTIVGQKDFVDISSEYQLDCVNRPVQLVIYKATFSKNGVSLSDLVASVRLKTDKKLGETEKFLFKLNRFNIDFKNTGFYENFRVVLAEPESYDTNVVGFPKITVINLVEGVFAVKYRLSLNSLTKYKL